MSNLPEVVISVASLKEDIQNGLSWYAKDDIGYGSIQEKYDARDFQIKIIQQHPDLVGVEFIAPTRTFRIVREEVEITPSFEGTTPKVETAPPVLVIPESVPAGSDADKSSMNEFMKL